MIAHRLWVALSLLVICPLSAAVHPDQIAAGREKAEAVCQTCHGMDGIATIAMAPNLSGQPREYLVIQLQAFREGRRRHPQMDIVAKSLTDEDIEKVASWYSSIKITVEMPEL